MKEHIFGAVNFIHEVLFEFIRVYKKIPRKMLNITQMYMIYLALFWSTVTYGIIVWSSTCDTNLKILHDIHKKVLKIIHDKSFYYPSEFLV